MKKKLPVVTVAERDEAARLAELPAEATVALHDLAGAIKDGFMAFCCTAGLAVVEEIMAAEMTEKAGPKGRHDPERTATRNGSAPGLKIRAEEDLNYYETGTRVSAAELSAVPRRPHRFHGDWNYTIAQSVNR